MLGHGEEVEGASPAEHVPRLGVQRHIPGEGGRVARDVDDGARGQPGELTTDEREELRRLRRENHVLKQEREILRKAAAYFAKEST